MSGRLPQRGYLWKRDWTPAVVEALAEAETRMDGVVVLGGEVVWTAKKPQLIKALIDWTAMQARPAECAIAMRIAPFPGPFAADDEPGRGIVQAAAGLMRAAQTHGIEPIEFQLDFDCGQSKLAGYRAWLQAIRGALPGVRVVITTLPAWLKEPEFAALIGDADGYVLQVHSVPTKPETGQATLCDPQLARDWVTRAARLGRPFSVALPTYRCLAGYDHDGKLLGVVMDSVQPAWPPETHILNFASDPDGIAGLVAEWQKARPPELRELIWYRIPVATDARNWRWPTLAAVMAGRRPRHDLEVRREGENPADIVLFNAGEAEETLDCRVTVHWIGPAPSASDALRGWSLAVTDGQAVFTPARGLRRELPPGEKQGIGWLRYEQTTPLRFELARADALDR